MWSSHGERTRALLHSISCPKRTWTLICGSKVSVLKQQPIEDPEDCSLRVTNAIEDDKLEDSSIKKVPIDVLGQLLRQELTIGMRRLRILWVYVAITIRDDIPAIHERECSSFAIDSGMVPKES